MPASKLTDRQREEIIRLHRLGWPPKRIAKEYGVTYHAILYYTRAIPRIPREWVLEVAV